MDGKVSGNFTLIWYSPTVPGVSPAKTGPDVGGPELLDPVYGQAGFAFGRKSNWTWSLLPLTLVDGAKTGAGEGAEAPVVTAGIVAPKPIA